MISFFWFQNDMNANYEALDAHAIDPIGGDEAYHLSPELKKESALITDTTIQQIIYLNYQKNTLVKETIDGLNETQSYGVITRSHTD
jgi:hypothetical protein